jgi:hypothetical protein
MKIESTKLRNLLQNLPDPDLCSDGPYPQPRVEDMWDKRFDVEDCLHYLRIELAETQPNRRRIAKWCRRLLRAEY